MISLQDAPHPLAYNHQRFQHTAQEDARRHLARFPMKLRRTHSILARIAGAILLSAGGHPLGASERSEFEGELRFNIQGSSSEPPPLVRVITLDGRVQQITLRDRREHSGRVEVLMFTGTTLTRYEVSSATPGQPGATFDLATDTTLSQQERERIASRAELLLRHFHSKGGYRKIPFSNAIE